MMTLPTVMSDDDATHLEELIDRVGLDGVIASLATICTCKAEHIRASYSDDRLASAWEEIEAKLDETMIFVATTLP